VEKIIQLLNFISKKTVGSVSVKIYCDGSGHFEDYKGKHYGPTFNDIRNLRIVDPSEAGVYEGEKKLF